MSGTLSRADLRDDHKNGLGKTAAKFTAANDADFDRHLNKALSGLSRVRRRTLADTLTLVAGQSDYSAPAGLLTPKVSKWGRGVIQPWEDGYGPLPRLSMYESDQGYVLHLSPAPSAYQISRFGDQYPYFYLANHVLGDLAADTTISEADRDLLLHLAMIEAVKELAASGITEPVNLHRGMGALNSNMTPAALLQVLEKQLERYL